MSLKGRRKQKVEIQEHLEAKITPASSPQPEQKDYSAVMAKLDALNAKIDQLIKEDKKVHATIK